MYRVKWLTASQFDEALAVQGYTWRPTGTIRHSVTTMPLTKS